MMSPVVLRCGVCGAPLEVPDRQVVVRCEYCRCENRLIEVEMERAMARSTRLQAAADEAQRLASELDTRRSELMAAFERDSQRAHLHRDRAAADAALHHMEGFLRLTYVPTLHFYRALEPDDPIVVTALAQIDRTIDEALATTAASLGIPYRTARERLGPAEPPR